MSLLDHLWDETVAGPQPDSGLGKLRKLSSFSQPGSSSWTTGGGGSPALTRSLTFLRPAMSPNGFGDSGPGSAPASPASVPGSPSPLSRERSCSLFRFSIPFNLSFGSERNEEGMIMNKNELEMDLKLALLCSFLTTQIGSGSVTPQIN